jgi:hypothetical protein
MGRAKERGGISLELTSRYGPFVIIIMSCQISSLRTMWGGGIEAAGTRKLPPPAPAKQAYKPFGAALHGTGIPLPAIRQTKSIGLHEDPGNAQRGTQSDALKKYGGFAGPIVIRLLKSFLATISYYR